VISNASSSIFWLNKAIQAVPSPAPGSRRWAAGRWRVENADVVETEEASLKHVLSEAVLSVHPPGEVQQELVERLP